MEQKTVNEQISQRTNEITDGKGGQKTASQALVEAAERESPLDEARRLNRETKELSQILGKLKEDLTEIAAFNALSGRAHTGMAKPLVLSPEEEKAAAAKAYSDKLLNAFR